MIPMGDSKSIPIFIVFCVGDRSRVVSYSTALLSMLYAYQQGVPRDFESRHDVVCIAANKACIVPRACYSPHGAIKGLIRAHMLS